VTVAFARPDQGPAHRAAVEPAAPLVIPPIGHFVWLGKRLPALAWLSVRSALDRGGLSQLVLHHDDAALAADPLAADLARRGVELRPLALGDGPDAKTAARLTALDGLLDRPASRVNLLRLRILWHSGGVYLDTDALVLRDLTPLCRDEGFAGLERVCLPAALYETHRPLPWLRAGLLLALRQAVAQLRDPGAAFARVEGLFDLACNNAILGAKPQHPLVGRLLRVAAQMPAQRALRRYQLGPRLLEEVTGNRSSQEFRLHPPHAFYPLAPEICAAYLRDDPHRELRPDARTYVAHLYDSVLARRLGGPVDSAWLARTRGRTLLARLCEPYLDDLLALCAHDPMAAAKAGR